jgi:choline dehydrogenase
LLLEAGLDLRARLPAALRDGWRIPSAFDWGFASEPDDRGVVEELRRGKILGGTSWLTRFALRGSPADFEDWAVRGNAGWGFEDVLPYFKRLEADADFGDRPWHGDSGPIPVTRYHELDLTEVGAASAQALSAVGFPTVEDHNRPGAVGAGRMPMSSRRGIRVTTADAYLPTAETPSNLVIQSASEVSEVVFDHSRAVGVRCLDGTVFHASRVVLSGGTYASPALLLRSGIGPGDHLRSVGVSARVDLRGVGSNLADHPGVDIDPGYRGPGRVAPVLHSIATFHSSGVTGDAAPDLMLWIADPVGDPSAFSIDVVLLKPQSRGTVRLRSPDPTQPPRIDLPNLREQTDVDRLAEALQRGRDVAGRPEVRRLCEESSSPVMREVEEVRGWIRQNAYSDPHVVGTCSMGPDPDDGAVVDAEGSVHGTDGLSIVDASIMPTPPSGFPHLITIMIAERLSERIAALI